MKISLIIILPEMKRGKVNAVIDAPCGAAVSDVLEQYANEDASFPLDVIKAANEIKTDEIVIMVNDNPAKSGYILKDGDSVRVYKPIIAG